MIVFCWHVNDESVCYSLLWSCSNRSPGCVEKRQRWCKGGHSMAGNWISQRQSVSPVCHQTWNLILLCVLWRCTHCVVTSDALFCFLSVFFLSSSFVSFLLFTSLSQQNLCSLLFLEDKFSWSETLTQCAEWYQLVVDYCLEIWPTLLGV